MTMNWNALKQTHFARQFVQLSKNYVNITIEQINFLFRVF